MSEPLSSKPPDPLAKKKPGPKPQAARLDVLEENLNAIAGLVKGLAQSVQGLAETMKPKTPPVIDPADFAKPDPSDTHTPSKTPPGYTDQEYRDALAGPRPSLEKVMATVTNQEMSRRQRGLREPGPVTTHGVHDCDVVTGEETWRNAS